MKLKQFNFIASLAAFLLGTVYLFSDQAGITANVIGATGNNAGLTALIGMVMIIGSIGLFIVSQHSTDNHSIEFERLLRKNPHKHEEMYQTMQDEEDISMHRGHATRDPHHKNGELSE